MISVAAESAVQRIQKIVFNALHNEGVEFDCAVGLSSVAGAYYRALREQRDDGVYCISNEDEFTRQVIEQLQAAVPA